MLSQATATWKAPACYERVRRPRSRGVDTRRVFIRCRRRPRESLFVTPWEHWKIATGAPRHVSTSIGISRKQLADLIFFPAPEFSHANLTAVQIFSKLKFFFLLWNENDSNLTQTVSAADRGHPPASAACCDINIWRYPLLECSSP